MDMSKLEQELAAANRVAGQIGPMVEIVKLVAKGVSQLLQKHGEDTAEFDAEIVKLDQASNEAAAAVAEFRAKFPEGETK